MRVTVFRAENRVIVDGEPADVDCSDLPSYFRVIQWDGVGGWIELLPDANGVYPGNMPVPDFAAYQVYVDRWRVARAAEAHELAALALADAEGAAEEQRRRAAEQKVARERQEAELAASAAEAVRLDAEKDAERAALAERIERLERQTADMAAALASLQPAVGAEPRP